MKNQCAVPYFSFSPKVRDPRLTPQPLFEDNHLLVVESRQPTSQADHSGSPDLLSLLKDWIKQRPARQVFLGLCSSDRPVVEDGLARPQGGVPIGRSGSSTDFTKPTWLWWLAGRSPRAHSDWLQKDHHSNTVRVGLPQAAILHYERIAVLQTKFAVPINRTISPDSGATGIVDIPPRRSHGQARNLSGPALWSHQLQLRTQPSAKPSFSTVFRQRPSFGRILN